MATKEILNNNIQQLFNLSLLEEMEDDEYTKDILQAFLSQTPVELDKLLRAGMQENYTEVAAVAHKLKGCTGLFQISGMARLLALIEQAAARGNKDVPGMVREVISIYRNIECSLRDHLKLMRMGDLVIVENKDPFKVKFLK